MVLGQRQLAIPVVLLLGLVTLALPSCAWGAGVDLRSQALAHYMMAVCYDLNDQTVQAIDEYQKSVKANGKESAPRLKLGAYYLRMDRLDKAQDQLKTVIRIFPQESQAHYLLALIYSSEHKYDQSAAEYEIVLKLAQQNQSPNADIYLYLGQLYYAQQKLPQAIEQFLKILQLEPENTSVLYLLGSVYADHNDRAKAVETFRRLLQLQPQDGDALNALGYMYAQDGAHLDEALWMVRKAIAMDPSNGAYYDSLGWVFYKKGMLAEALTALQKAAMYIQDPLLYEHIGDVYKTQKEFAKARNYWRKSLDLDPHQNTVHQKIKEVEKWIASQSYHPQN